MSYEDQKYGDAWDKRYYKDFMEYYAKYNYDGSDKRIVVATRAQKPARDGEIVLLLARVRWNELS